MDADRLDILKVKLDNLTVQSAVRSAVDFVDRNPKGTLFFLNLDCLAKAQKDEEYRKVLNSSPLVLPDGIGLKLAAALFGRRVKENCNGTDFSPLLMSELTKQGYNVFLLGGQEGVAEKAAEVLRARIPGIRIAGTHHGYFESDDAMIEEINRSGADILFVAMGVPLQEKWIYRNREKLDPRLCLGVGALFDWLSGRHQRSPLLLRRMNLEWLWRIAIEPRRMSKRYLVYGLGFFLSLLVYRLRRQTRYG